MSPRRADPVPFCLNAFFVVPRTSDLVLLLAFPLRRAASCHTATECMISDTGGSAPLTKLIYEHLPRRTGTPKTVGFSAMVPVGVSELKLNRGTFSNSVEENVSTIRVRRRGNNLSEQAETCRLEQQQTMSAREKREIRFEGMHILKDESEIYAP